MSKSKHSEAQIIAALKQVEAGRTAEDVAREPMSQLRAVCDSKLCRESHRFHSPTLHNWPLLFRDGVNDGR